MAVGEKVAEHIIGVTQVCRAFTCLRAIIVVLRDESNSCLRASCVGESLVLLGIVVENPF